MKQKGLTDVDVSESSGLPRMTIGNARRGNNVTLKTAFLISKALAEPLDKIWSSSIIPFPEKDEEREKVA